MEPAVIEGPDDASADAWWFLDTLVVEHQPAGETGGVVLEMTLPVGHSPALHVHETLDDSWFVLAGRLAARCGDDHFMVEAGTWVSMPRGVPHTFRVVGDEPARILLVHDNATFRDFVRDLGAPAAERVPPPVPSFPPMDELARVAGSHDLRPIGPPMTPEDAAAIETATPPTAGSA
jgi:mannose-6-phosphate isomerase-like protein (cupin superfamily)